MKHHLSFVAVLVSSLFVSEPVAASMMTMDTCLMNDACHQAQPISGIVSDQSFVCVSGCNMYAAPDTIIQSCQMGDFPTVWFTPELDPAARVMNIEVISTEFESPVISVFKSSTDCDELEQVYLSNSNLLCIIGTGGKAKAVGIEVQDGQTYFIAISSLYSIGGHFDVCVSALSYGSNCVVDRGIEITARSNGGPLEGPFDPGETVSVCMNVYSYTAEGNGCQWFQGLVPVFGNGWDPASFDSIGQPSSALVNGDTIGEAQNGLYGSSTWDWFTDVGYHHDHPTYTVADLDTNGRVDMCNSAFELDCPHQGISGGCCGPCWADLPGQILPGGWFAYGINGTCADEGPPVGFDWGDGNTCGDSMGPWHFCFELQTREIPDCAGDTTRRDLSLGFYTFADGEIGSWAGGESVCAYDTPTKLSLKAKCGRVSTTDTDVLDPLCTGDTLRYIIEAPGIVDWEWNISPFWAAPSLVNRGENGVQIEIPLINTGQSPIDIHATLIGHEADSGNILLRKFTFKLQDQVTCGITGISPDSPDRESAITLHPMPAGDDVRVQWSFDLRQEAFIDVFDSQGVFIHAFRISPDDHGSKQIRVDDLSPGVYYLRLRHADFRAVKKMVRM